jgi:proteic killer suppression protein
VATAVDPAGGAFAIFQDRRTPDLPSGIHSTARRKLVQINLAQQLSDLRVAPGNHLEALKGDRKGRPSIRINDQWRVCFSWTPSGAENVKIEDHH